VAEPLPSFDLMDDAGRDHVFALSDEACDCCGKARGWKYTGPVYGEADEPVLCPWCIRDGRAAAELGCSFNDAHDYENNLSVPDRVRVTVRERTPGFVTWQQNHWKVCCGSACKFMDEATVENLKGRWASLVPAIRAELIGPIPWVDEWLEKHAAYGGAPSVYIFQCRVCEKAQFFWDIH
jgi:uncharacterized protein CbrC (UPF0167 family)